MSLRSRGRRRGLRGALIACALIAAAMLGFATQSASATVACPSGGNRAGEIERWETTYEGRGVTLCSGMAETFAHPEVRGYLQIVDLRAGAKIRLAAKAFPEWVEGVEPEENEEGYEGYWQYPSPYETESIYEKKSTKDWYKFIERLSPFEIEAERNWSFLEPEPGRLFSTINASFFTNTTNNEPTTVPFPLDTLGSDDSMGVSFTRGLGDPDYEAPKKSLELGSLNEHEIEHEGGQLVRVKDFDANYETEDVAELFHLSERPELFDTLDAAVGFTPEYRVGGLARRNYVGVHEEVVYIFTSDDAYTNAEAVEIMEEIHPSMDLIQLDGGGSASIYSRYASMGTLAEPIEERQVPDVLAVYTAEE